MRIAVPQCAEMGSARPAQNPNHLSWLIRQLVDKVKARSTESGRVRWAAAERTTRADLTPRQRAVLSQQSLLIQRLPRAAREITTVYGGIADMAGFAGGKAKSGNPANPTGNAPFLV